MRRSNRSCYVLTFLDWIQLGCSYLHIPRWFRSYIHFYCFTAHLSSDRRVYRNLPNTMTIIIVAIVVCLKIIDDRIICFAFLFYVRFSLRCSFCFRDHYVVYETVYTRDFCSWVIFKKITLSHWDEMTVKMNQYSGSYFFYYDYDIFFSL